MCLIKYFCICLVKRFHILKKVVVVLALWICVSVFAFVNQSSLWVSRDTSHKTETTKSTSPDRQFGDKGGLSISKHGRYPEIYNTTQLGQGQGTKPNEVHCTFPDIDPFDPAVLALSKFNPPITCEGGVPHLVYVSGDTIKVNHSKTGLVGDSENRFQDCLYKALAKAPGSDLETVVTYTSDRFNDSITLRDTDDSLVVECYDSNNTVLSRSYFSLIRVKNDLELLLQERHKKHLALNAPKEVLNVLMIGIDGNSKQNFQRHMPKTRSYLLNVLNAIELHKYNKFAEHTYTNLVPLLSGKTWLELQTKNWTFSKLFDYVNHDFLWSHFRKVGYRTGVFFDDSFVTAFHFQKKGWDKPPADYYHRAVVLELERDKLMKAQGLHCVGDVPEIKFNHDFWVRMATTFNNSKPYFGFSFSTHLTHDDHNMASAGDHLYLAFLQELTRKNIINNTVIVFFSDHGERFGRVRSTYNGMIESKTPYIFLVFPPWFHRKYPHLMEVLKINQERLTTNKDVYETVRDLINFQASTGLGDINKRGISLFQEIPRERTCQHAGITVEYCVCNQMIQANVSSVMALALAETVLEKLNRLTENIRDKCNDLSLGTVKDVLMVKSTQNNTLQNNVSLYQITITTTPGRAIYESTLEFFHPTIQARVIGDITRLNMYRGQAECIQDTRLLPFCFCKRH